MGSSNRLDLLVVRQVDVARCQGALQLRRRAVNSGNMVAAILCGALVVGCSEEQETEAVAELESQSNLEQEPARQPRREWAGEYWRGDGLGDSMNLVLGREGMFQLEILGCERLPAHILGEIEEGQGKILLTPSEVAPELHNVAWPLTLEVVVWGNRRYLVESDEIVGFCNEVNCRMEPRRGRWGSFFLRVNDWADEVSGKPVVPAVYRPYLLSKPIEAGVLSVRVLVVDSPRPNLVDRFDVALDVGRRDGVLPGLEFHIEKPSDAFWLLASGITVTRVEDEICWGTAGGLPPGMELPDASELPPNAEWFVSTCPTWMKPR